MPSGNVPILVGSVDTPASGTTLVVPYTTVPPLGSRVVMGGRQFDGTAQAISSISDGVNTWTIRENNNNGNAGFIADAYIIGDMTGLSSTVTFASAGQFKLAWMHMLGAVDVTNPNVLHGTTTVLFNGTARNTNPNSFAASQPGDIFMVYYMNSGSSEAAETSFSATSPFTNLPGVTGSGYFSGTHEWIEGSYWVATDMTKRNPAGTGGASPIGFAALYAVYRKAPPPYSPQRMPLGV